MPASSSASVEYVSTSAPTPRPGPAGPDIDALRVAFDDLLNDSVGSPEPLGGSHGDADFDSASVRDDQVAALDAAHELLADALTALDSQN